MATGAPMDLAVHLGAIPAEQAARTLEWQKVRFESAQSLSFKRGRSMSPEAEIALEDVSRLRDEVQRGRERLFHASLSVTLHADDQDTLKDITQKARAHFAATLGKLDNLAFRQREGLLSTLPLALNAVAVWRTLDTSSAWHGCSPFRRRTWTPAPAPSTASTCGPAPPSSTTPSTERTSTPTPPSWPVRAAARVSPPSWACCEGCAGGCGPTSSTRRASTPTWQGPPVDGCSPPASPARA